jgi:hypothetical protein
MNVKAIYVSHFCRVWWQEIRYRSIPWAAGFLSLAMGGGVLPALVVVLLSAAVVAAMVA